MVESRLFGNVSSVYVLPPCGHSGKALSYINKQYFSDANGNRGGAPNVAVVLVDGWPTDKVEEASRQARESGINIFFVTIEGPDDNEKHNVVEPNFVDKVTIHFFDCCQFISPFNNWLLKIDVCTAHFPVLI